MHHSVNVLTKATAFELLLESHGSLFTLPCTKSGQSLGLGSLLQWRSQTFALGGGGGDAILMAP